jgi:hypothetical protein
MNIGRWRFKRVSKTVLRAFLDQTCQMSFYIPPLPPAYMRPKKKRNP